MLRKTPGKSSLSDESVEIEEAPDTVRDLDSTFDLGTLDEDEDDGYAFVSPSPEHLAHPGQSKP